MTVDRLIALFVAGFVVLVAVATSPYVGLVSIPEGGLGGGGVPGTGSADIAVVSAPDRATLQADRFSEVHTLRVPAAELSVSAVTGEPLLTMSVEIPSLGYQRSSLYAIADQAETNRSFHVERSTIDSSAIDRESYPGTLRIVLRDGDGRTVVYEDRISIRVTG